MGRRFGHVLDTITVRSKLRYGSALIWVCKEAIEYWGISEVDF